jgi:hypothetical protein
LAPRRHVGPAGFIEIRARRAVDDAELAAALEVGLHDRGDLLRRRILPSKGRDGDGKLGEADSGDLDAELGECGPACGRQGQPASQRHQFAAAPQFLFNHVS